MSQPLQCLNCNNPLQGKYCNQCGQKADTHRLNSKHFFLHDIVHGVWHMDKGVPFTIAQALKRPGYAAMDYLSGKRVKYYNVFYLCLILLGINLFIAHNVTELQENFGVHKNHKPDELELFLIKYYKVFYFSTIPAFASICLLFFRRLKLNYAEHCLVSGFGLLGTTLVIVSSNIAKLAAASVSLVVYSPILSILSFIAFLAPGITYFQATRRQYTIMGFLWRIVLCYIIAIIIMLLFVMLIIALSHGGKIEGTFTI
jgi:uncharacterized integral membrane protein